MRVHIMHGIHVSEPKGGVGKLEEYFHAGGFSEVVVHRYGHIFAFQTRWKNPKLAEQYCGEVLAGDIVVGHSNGCTLWWMISQMNAPIAGAILINPALDNDKALAPQVPWVDVYHNEGDSAVSLSRLLLWHPWGDQGKIGFTGDDPRYQNIDCGKSEPRVDGHSAIFKDENLHIWGPRIVENARKRLNMS